MFSKLFCKSAFEKKKKKQYRGSASLGGGEVFLINFYVKQMWKKTGFSKLGFAALCFWLFLTQNCEKKLKLFTKHKKADSHFFQNHLSTKPGLEWCIGDSAACYKVIPDSICSSSIKVHFYILDHVLLFRSCSTPYIKHKFLLFSKVRFPFVVNQISRIFLKEKLSSVRHIQNSIPTQSARLILSGNCSQGQVFIWKLA